MAYIKRFGNLLSKSAFAYIFYLVILFILPINAALAAKKVNVEHAVSAKVINEEYVRSFVQDVIDKTLVIVESKQSEAQKSDELRGIFEQCVDIDGMARMAIGKKWLALTADQRKDYLLAYRSFLIKTFIPKFKDYNSQKVIITKINQVDGKKFVVSLQFVSTNVAPNSVNSANKINMIYRIFAVNGPKGVELKIRDIVIEEMSLLRTQRDDFASTITTKGIEGLIAALKAK